MTWSLLLILLIFGAVCIGGLAVGVVLIVVLTRKKSEFKDVSRRKESGE